MEKENNVPEEINLYNQRDPRNRIIDGEPRALYWYKYRETYNFMNDYISEGNIIHSPLKINELPNEEIMISNYVTQGEFLLLDLPIVLAGNNRLKPFDFDIRKKDRSVIDGVDYPGKSCTIAFSDNLSETCGAIFDRDCRRQDRMYVATISQIQECNYNVYYLPIGNQPLHVRLVHKSHEINPSIHLPPFKDREKLAEVFSRRRIGK